jgi:hypothetical protein
MSRWHTPTIAIGVLKQTDPIVPFCIIFDLFAMFSLVHRQSIGNGAAGQIILEARGLRIVAVAKRFDNKHAAHPIDTQSHRVGEHGLGCKQFDRKRLGQRKTCDRFFCLSRCCLDDRFEGRWIFLCGADSRFCNPCRCQCRCRQTDSSAPDAPPVGRGAT